MTRRATFLSAAAWIGLCALSAWVSLWKATPAGYQAISGDSSLIWFERAYLADMARAVLLVSLLTAAPVYGLLFNFRRPGLPSRPAESGPAVAIRPNSPRLERTPRRLPLARGLGARAGFGRSACALLKLPPAATLTGRRRLEMSRSTRIGEGPAFDRAAVVAVAVLPQTTAAAADPHSEGSPARPTRGLETDDLMRRSQCILAKAPTPHSPTQYARTAASGTR